MTENLEPTDANELDQDLLAELQAAFAEAGDPADLPLLQIDGRDFDTIVITTEKTNTEPPQK